MDYEVYITSERWRKLRACYEEKYPKRCYVCASEENIHLHHKSYKRLGEERLRDLVWLCERCHSDIHHALRRRASGRLTLWNVARRYKRYIKKTGRQRAHEWVHRDDKKIAPPRDWSKQIAQAERELRAAHERMELPKKEQ